MCLFEGHYVVFLTVVNLLNRTDRKCLVVWFWVDKRPICCCFFLYKNSLDTQTSFWVDGHWNRP